MSYREPHYYPAFVAVVGGIYSAASCWVVQGRPVNNPVFVTEQPVQSCLMRHHFCDVVHLHQIRV